MPHWRVLLRFYHQVACKLVSRISFVVDRSIEIVFFHGRIFRVCNCDCVLLLSATRWGAGCLPVCSEVRFYFFQWPTSLLCVLHYELRCLEETIHACWVLSESG